MENFKLNYINSKTKKSEEFTILFKKPTGAVASVFWECLPQLPQDVNNMQLATVMLKYIPSDIDKQKLSQEELNKLSSQAFAKAVIAGEIDTETMNRIFNKSNNFTKEEKEKELSLYITMLKACIDTNEMTNEQKKLIESSENSDFWQGQELVTIRSAVNFFRNFIV